MKAGHIYIGTSGWSYKSWAEAFYPAGLPPGKQLAYYTTKFPTVEVNRTFYCLPTEKALGDWKRTAPGGFLYSLKGSRAVTHFKRLQPGAKSLNILLDRSKSLGETCGPLLWQLPGTLKKDLPRLRNFIRTLQRPQLRHAIEFRDPSWLDEEVFGILRQYGVANAAVSSQKMPGCLEVTANFVYVRFHGLEGGAAHDYTDREMQPWATFLRSCGNREISGFVYFNNDMNARAPLNAFRLMELIGSSALPLSQRVSVATN
jgi:uncharacterized protein YecE (DUF72 family)